MSYCRIFFASVLTGVFGDTHSTFLCIIFLTFIVDLLSVVGAAPASHETLPQHRQALIQINSGSNRYAAVHPDKDCTMQCKKSIAA